MKGLCPIKFDRVILLQKKKKKLIEPIIFFFKFDSKMFTD